MRLITGMMLLFLIGCRTGNQRQAQYNTDSLLTTANRVECETILKMKQSYQDYLYLLSR